MKKIRQLCLNQCVCEETKFVGGNTIIETIPIGEATNGLDKNEFGRTLCVANNTQSCKSCENGRYLIQINEYTGICLKNQCVCQNGIAAELDECIFHQARQCVSCDTENKYELTSVEVARTIFDYMNLPVPQGLLNNHTGSLVSDSQGRMINYQTNICQYVPDKCYCDNGIGSEDAPLCLKEGDHSCASCDKFYHLVNELPTRPTPTIGSFCAKNTCICTDGLLAENCLTDGQESCQACNRYFYLDPPLSDSDDVMSICRNAGRTFCREGKVTLGEYEHEINNVDFTYENCSATDVLNLSGMDIPTVPNFFFIELLNLQELRLARNNLGFIPKTLFRTNTILRILDLSFNFIFELEAEVFQTVPLLEELYLNNNELTYLPTFSADHFLRLNRLHLYDNMFTPRYMQLILDDHQQIFNLHVDRDWNNFLVCLCQNGIPSYGFNCPAMGLVKCDSCDPGYILDTDSNNCEPKICTCPNGSPSRGYSCPQSGALHCAACDTGWHLSSNRPEDGCQFFPCKYEQFKAYSADGTDCKCLMGFRTTVLDDLTANKVLYSDYDFFCDRICDENSGQRRHFDNPGFCQCDSSWYDQISLDANCYESFSGNPGELKLQNARFPIGGSLNAKHDASKAIDGNYLSANPDNERAQSKSSSSNRNHFEVETACLTEIDFIEIWPRRLGQGGGNNHFDRYKLLKVKIGNNYCDSINRSLDKDYMMRLTNYFINDFGHSELMDEGGALRFNCSYFVPDTNVITVLNEAGPNGDSEFVELEEIFVYEKVKCQPNW